MDGAIAVSSYYLGGRYIEGVAILAPNGSFSAQDTPSVFTGVPNPSNLSAVLPFSGLISITALKVDPPTQHLVIFDTRRVSVVTRNFTLIQTSTTLFGPEGQVLNLSTSTKDGGIHTVNGQPRLVVTNYNLISVSSLYTNSSCCWAE